MPTSDWFGPADLPADAEREAQESAPEPEPDEPRHIHQIVSVHMGATADTVFVSRTETLIEHRHAPPDREQVGDLWDEHARALGLPRPRPESRLVSDEAEERPAGRLRARHPLPRRDGARSGAPDAAGWMSFGAKTRIPGHLTRAQLDAYLKQERRVALEVRDPVAISYAAERYNTITMILQELPEGDPLDLLKPVLSVSQAAKILGYNAKEVRRLLGQGKISGRKVGSEWRIPLRAVL